MYLCICRTKAWATYCWPEKDWNINTLSQLYQQNKVLCGIHFEESCFLDSSKKRISKFAIPGTKEYKLNLIETLRNQAAEEQVCITV